MKKIAWPRIGLALAPFPMDLERDAKLSSELQCSIGSWARPLRVDDYPAGVLELFGEPVFNLAPGGTLGVGTWWDDPTYEGLAIRARLVRFRPDGTAAYLEARLPGPGWKGPWQVDIRGIELERSAVRVRKAVATVELLRDWLGRDTTAATKARQAKADELAAEAEALRASGMTIEKTAETLKRSSAQITRLRRRVKGSIIS